MASAGAAHAYAALPAANAHAAANPANVCCDRFIIVPFRSL